LTGFGKLQQFSCDRCRRLFTNVEEIVFVYAFTAPRNIQKEITKITKDTFKDLRHPNIINILDDAGIIDSKGMVSFDFQSMTKGPFVKKLGEKGIEPQISVKVFSILKDFTFSSSVIAKIELLTLQKEFSNYAVQKGIGQPKQTLKICQIPTKW